MIFTIKLINENFRYKFSVYSSKAKRHYDKWYLTKSGVLEFIGKSRVLPNKKEALLNYLGISNEYYLINHIPEMVFKQYLISLCNDLKLQLYCQYSIETWRIDFYIPKFNLLIWYDEASGHKGQLLEEDIEQTEYLESLGYNTLRVKQYEEGSALAHICKLALVK